MKKLICIVLICIMTFAIVGCSNEPAKAVHVDNYLAAIVGGDSELIDAALIYPQNASMTKEGITVTAKQAVADKHTMYVLLTVTAKPDVEFTYTNGFDMYSASVSEKGGTCGVEWTTVSKDKKTLYVVVGVDSEEGLDKGTASVALWDLKTAGGSDDEYGIKTYTGNWNIKFGYEIADITERYTSDTIVKTDGVELKFDYIDISPFGVYTSFSLADSSINPGDDWDYDSMDIDVVLKDGTEVGITNNRGSADFGGAREEFNYYRSGRLIAAIDPAEVSHILINGENIEFK